MPEWCGPRNKRLHKEMRFEFRKLCFQGIDAALSAVELHRCALLVGLGIRDERMNLFFQCIVVVFQTLARPFQFLENEHI
jgi:hypothetical protein